MNQLRGSSSADVDFASYTDEEVDVLAQPNYKKNGFCGTTAQADRAKPTRSKAQERTNMADNEYCMCMKQKCCGGYSKCESNRSICTRSGFNCVMILDEPFPLDYDMIESKVCDSPKYKTICSTPVDEDFVLDSASEVEGDKFHVDGIVEVFETENEEVLNADIKCIWNSPFQACTGAYPKLYTCSVPKYSKVCCTDSTITQSKFDKYGTCTKGGAVPVPPAPTPTKPTQPTYDSIKCYWDSTWTKCKNPYPVPYTCDGKQKNVCCTVSSITKPTLKDFGTCTKVGAATEDSAVKIY